MKSNTNIIEKIDKIDFEDLIKDFRVLNIDEFTSYLKEIWKDLSQRTDKKNKGIDKITFSKYYELPGIINDRLFAVFDSDKNESIDLKEFIDGMITLFSEDYEKLIKFIFNLYDFDKDGFISKEDIRIVLSYVPLNTENFKNTFSRFLSNQFKDRIESQDEIFSLLEKVFKTNNLLDIKRFTFAIENISSDIFLFVLIYLMQKKPFSKSLIEEFATRNNNGEIPKSPSFSKKLIASPNLQSKFSPSVIISKSPSMKATTISHTSNRLGTNLVTGNLNNNNQESKNFLMKFAIPKTGGNSTSENHTVTLKYGNNDDQSITDVGDLNERTDTSIIKSIPVNRKKRNDLKNLENATLFSKEKKEWEDVPLDMTVKKNNLHKSNDILEKKHENKDDSSDEENGENEEIRFEGHIYKLTKTSKKLQKIYFKLVHKDLFFYKYKDDTNHAGLHNLSGIFIREEPKTEIHGIPLFCFSIVYGENFKNYYVDNEKDFINWVTHIKKATGCSNLTDTYEIKQKIGNGKFGLVKLGVHKENNLKTAIKIINKKDMKSIDKELVQTEIEILKICQHPNIIRLYDVFENLEYIYIVMEYCGGGDMFNYLSKRGFALPENRAAIIIHKLVTAIFYLHSYGIAHRDLKPENILMTDDTEEAELKILDFGLSKILGPNELATEPYGTLSYVAPEVLLEKPYDKSVDIWSLGIILFLLIFGYLPYDDENSENEIARQTIFDPIPFPAKKMSKVSSEVVNLIKVMLDKDPTKRPNLKKILEDPWITRYNKSALPEKRRKSRDTSSECDFQIYTTTDENSIK